MENGLAPARGRFVLKESLETFAAAHWHGPGACAMGAPMTQDRLAIDPDSPFHNEDLLSQGIGIRFNGSEKTNVEEYCVSEGWIKVAAGTARDRKGKPILLKLKGTVEPFLKGDAA